MSDTQPPLRVGDRERRAVDDLLQAAVGDGVLTLREYDERSALLWQSRTRDDLDHLVADLPGQSAPARVPAVASDAGTPRRAVAVMSEDRMSGQVAAGQEVQGWALMGKAVLDLRRDDLPDSVHVLARAVMGEVEVMVPPGSAVHLSGFSVMGERKVQVGAGDGPDVHVDAIAVMGTVKVTVGDGSVVKSGRTPTAVPAPRPSSVAVPDTGRAVHRSGGHRSRVFGRAKGLAVPALVLGAVVLAGPDNVTVFGNNVETVRSGDDQVQVSRLFGNITVVVPDDRQVDPSNIAIFGNVECEQACANDGEALEVRTFGAFGNVEIVTQQERAAQLEDEAEEERQEELEERREGD